jgi:hypothetical protein
VQAVIVGDNTNNGKTELCVVILSLSSRQAGLSKYVREPSQMILLFNAYTLSRQARNDSAHLIKTTYKIQ